MITIRSRLARPAMALALIATGGFASAAPTPSARPAAPALLSPDQAIPPAALEALVDVTVRQTMAREHIAGVTVAVVQDGKVVLKKGYGLADVARQRPVDPDRTLFRVGSISKTFTWLMTLSAVERGVKPAYPGWRRSLALVFKLPAETLFATADDAAAEPKAPR